MAIRYQVSGYLSSDIALATRTRDAVRRIRRLPDSPTQKKKYLAEWFRIHEMAALAPGAKAGAYRELLGEFHRSRLQG